MRPAFPAEADAAKEEIFVLIVVLPVKETAANWNESQFVFSAEPAPETLKVWLDES